MEKHTLERLFSVIEGRVNADSKLSYTAQLLSNGHKIIGKKLGEEAVELIIAAVSGDKKNIIDESSDLLYHLLVLWKATNVNPNDIWEELDSRFEVSGLEEKSSRNTD